MSYSSPQGEFPEPLRVTSMGVREVSVQTRGPLRASTKASSSTRLSRIAMVVGFVSLALTPVFGVGVIPAIGGVILGHIAKHREPQGFFRSALGLGASYAALVIGTAIVIFVALPITLAFLVSSGYILAD